MVLFNLDEVGTPLVLDQVFMSLIGLVRLIHLSLFGVFKLLYYSLSALTQHEATS